MLDQHRAALHALEIEQEAPRNTITAARRLGPRTWSALSQIRSKRQCRRVSDSRFVSSNSHESASNILVRLTDIDEDTFDKRLSDLWREVQNKENTELPEEADSPQIIGITTANERLAAGMGVRHAILYTASLPNPVSRVRASGKRPCCGRTP